jgi:sugar/nucleoside kinase (ribokinase family)
LENIFRKGVHMSLLVVGSIAYDSIKTPNGEVSEALGGSTTYFSAAATHLTPVNIVGVVGNDFDEKEYDFLKDRGADLSGLQKMDGETFRWKGEYVGDMNEAKTLDTKLNVFEHFSPELNSDYRKSDLVFLGNIDPELQLKVLEQVENPKLVALDTMNLWINIKNEALKKAVSKVDLVVMNHQEALSFTECSNVVLAGKKIRAMGPKAVIIKKGEHGAYLHFEDKQFAVPAFPIEKVVDPTGAGDSFAGGVMGYLTTCKNIDFNTYKEAMIYGTLMASYNVEAFSVEKLKELDKPSLADRREEYIDYFTL